MAQLVVGKNRRRLETPEGAPAFLLAEVLGAAVTEARDPEWEALLERRSAQGFDALLLDLLPAGFDPALVNARIHQAEDFGFTVLLGVDEVFDGLAPEAVRVARMVPQMEPSALHLDYATALVADVAADPAAGTAEALDVHPELPLIAIPCHDTGTARTTCRRALWTALLGGSLGGVAYRAEGLWDWRAPGKAVAFPAAEDFVFVRQAVDYFDLTWGEPWDDIVAPACTERGARAMRTSSTALFYLPEAMELDLLGDFSEAFVQAIDLTSGEGTRLDFTWNAGAGISTVPAPPFKEDALYVVRL